MPDVGHVTNSTEYVDNNNVLDYSRHSIRENCTNLVELYILLCDSSVYMRSILHEMFYLNILNLY